MWFSMNLKIPFEYDSDILEYTKNIIEIHKLAVIPENKNNNMFIFGHEYYDEKNNIMNNITFSINKTSITNSSFTPLFDIDDGFRCAFCKDNYACDYVNNKYKKWLENRCVGNIFE
jgi:hypothetical protein